MENKTVRDVSIYNGAFGLYDKNNYSEGATFERIY